VEELEDRLGDRMEEILSHVRSSLTLSPAPITAIRVEQIEGFDPHAPTDYVDMDEDAYVQEEIMFDDTGEGVGVEGDLDMDDD